jgi:hypothetical protein
VERQTADKPDTGSVAVPLIPTPGASRLQSVSGLLPACVRSDTPLCRASWLLPCTHARATGMPGPLMNIRRSCRQRRRQRSQTDHPSPENLPRALPEDGGCGSERDAPDCAAGSRWLAARAQLFEPDAAGAYFEVLGIDWNEGARNVKKLTQTGFNWISQPDSVLY